MNNIKNKQNLTSMFETNASDDANVLNYLLVNVRGISSTSFAPAYLVNNDNYE